jgi:TP901 family phage tail tape measure protein
MSRQSIQAGKAVIVVELTDRATMQFSKLTSGLSAQIMKASRSLRNLSTGAAGGLFATGVAVRNTMKDFISFEDQMLNLTVKLGYFGNLTQEQSGNIEGLRKTIMNLGRTTAFTSKEVADAAVSLAQAGFSVDEIKGSLKGALDFARGTGYALGDSADMLANIVRTFNMFGANDTLETRMNKITNVTSQMVKATRLGTIEIQDLRESLKYASGTAGNLGIKLPVLLGFLVQMSESGLKASLAGTSMNTALLNMIKSSDKLKTIAPNFSIATDAAGNEDLVTTMYELFKISSKMSKIEQAAFFQDIFNIRGARAISSVQEMERVTEFIEQIQKAGAESALAAAKMEEGVGGATRRLASAFETLNITIGKVAEGKLVSLFNLAAYGVTIFEEWMKQNGLLALSYLALPPILAGVMIGALALSFALSRLAKAMSLVTIAGKGLRFLGGSLKNTAAMLPTGGQSARAMQAAKVARLQRSIDAAMSGGNATKVAGSKTMAKLIKEAMKLQKMGRGGLFGAIGRGIMGAGRGAGQAAMSSVRGIRSGAAAIAQRKEAIRTNKLMNSAIRGEQMIALKNERAFQAQMAKVSAPAKAATRQIAALPGISAKRVTQLNQINNTLKVVAQNEGRLALFAAMQERSYDRLYSVRKQIAALEAAPIEQIVGAKAGKRTPLTQAALKQQEIARQAKLNSLRAREARLVGIVNRNIGPQQQFFAAQRAKIEKQFAAKQVVAGREQLLTQANIQRSLDAKTAAKTAATRTRQAKTVQALDRTIAGKRVASEMKLATLRSRLTSVRGVGSMAGGLASGAMKGLTGGFKSLRGMMTGANLLRAGQGIMTLAGGFLRLAGSVGRFVFSWNFVGMIFNVLLMFGDKIPAVVNAFKALGAGISGAFGELGKVASYAGPAMNLFKLAFSAFRQGETGVGVQALQTGFMGLVDIIKNQLVAAWNTFLVHVEYMWIVLRKIFEGLKVIFMSIFEGISKTFGFMASPIMASLGDVFGSGGGGNMAQTATMIVQGIDMFVTGFFKGLISLSETLQTFLADFQTILGRSIYTLTGMNAGKEIEREGMGRRTTTEMQASIARGMLEYERKQRAKQLEQIMAISPQEVARRRAGAAAGANERSAQTSYGMDVVYEGLINTLDRNLAKRAADLNSLQQEPKGPSDAQLATQKQKAYNEVQTELAAVRARLAEADQEQGSTDMQKLYDSLQTPEDLGQDNTRLSALSDLIANPGIVDAREKAALLQREQFLLRSLYSTQNNPQQQLQQELPKFLQALTGGAMSTRAILRTDTKRQEDLMKEGNALQQETNRLLSVQGGIG